MCVCVWGGGGRGGVVCVCSAIYDILRAGDRPDVDVCVHISTKAVGAVCSCTGWKAVKSGSVVGSK